MKLTINPVSSYLQSCNRSNEMPYERLFEDGIVELRSYGAGTSPPGLEKKTPLLIVPPVAVNPNLYDYHPQYSVVNILQQQGFDVYLLSWGDTGYKDRHNSFTRYFNWVEQAAELIKQRRGVAKLFLVGYCSGGMLSAFYASLRDDVAKLVLINTPIDFTPENNAGHITNIVNSWPMYLSGGRLSIVDMPNAMYSYSGKVNTRMYQLTSPMAVVKGNLKMWRELRNRQATEVNVSMAEALQMKGFPGAVMQQLLHFTVNNAIVGGDVEIDGNAIDLANIEVPLLCCAGDSDGMATHNAVTAITDVVSSSDKEVYIAQGGHVGSVFSTNSVHKTWGKIGDWLEGEGAAGRMAREPSEVAA
jgi:polyhydroxyalkanoate synthase